MQDERLEILLEEMRGETAPAAEVAAARERVWGKLACAAFAGEIEPYRQGGLAEAQRLLMDDHLSRCAECRRKLADAKGERNLLEMPAEPRRISGGWMRWAAAAGIAALSLYLGMDRIDSALAPAGPRATVEAVNGQLFRVSQGVLQVGAEVGEEEWIRTGAGSRALLRLSDGSRLEVNERTELSFRAAYSGLTVALDNGDVIVEAARQRRGSLRVQTRDSVASVKGTVFGVSTGAAGSLVSVVEGSVEVKQAGGSKVLSAGQVAATTYALHSVPVRDTVGWSQNAEKYYALLGEFMQIEKQLAALPAPALRREAKLLRYLPDHVVVYGAIPNLDGTIRQAVSMVERRAADSDVLRQWWTSEHGKELKTLLESLQTVTPLLGEEVVVALTKEPASPASEIPVILAQVQPGRKAALEEALQRLAGQTKASMAYQVTDELLLISDNAPHLALMSARLGRGASGAFAAEIGQRYSGGVGWLAGVDVMAPGWGLGTPEIAGLFGASKMKHVFLEWRSVQGMDENEASLTFAGARTGMASWLASPGAAGSAEYTSSDAVLAISASTKDPRQALSELLATAGSVSKGLTDAMREFEQKTGLSVAGDIAPALGTNFTVTIERPTIPLPGWVAALEVNQPALLDAAARRLVEVFNRELAPEQGAHRLLLGQETVNGRVWMSLKSAASPITLYWTYDRGYLVAGTDRALAGRAVATRESGSALVRSARFRTQLPSSSSLHYSGFFWLNTSGALAELGGLFNGSMKTILENREPTLIVLNGETERIHAASRTRFTSLLLDLMVAGGPKE